MLLCQQNEIYRGILEYTQARGHTSVKHVMLLYQQNIVNRGILEYTQTRSQTNVALSEQSHFQTRMRVHTGVKPYKCELCDAAFWFIVTLQNHIRKQHELKKESLLLWDLSCFFSPKESLTTDYKILPNTHRHVMLLSKQNAVYKRILKYTQARSHTSVKHVMLLCQQKEIYRGILEYTQARGHTSVKHVMLLYQQNAVYKPILIIIQLYDMGCCFLNKTMGPVVLLFIERI
ncbi:hypothetical protein MAR_015131 [Mya arenaria]|uniref:C2H2-type domain-containing protein n=1 Tax=Mya arenaria TaxID=6604 RepID=A0ABY7FGB2_MYAAR|nr:hypothetical protein MAR_015131 [Mya arenaria]